MSWLYEITTGRLTNPDGKVVATGYAGGNCGKNPEGKNNPAMCGVKNVGPLPPGGYTFSAPIAKSHLGPFAIPLEPDLDNDMMGRSDFFMHGDTTPPGNASEGCIIMPRIIREACWASSDHELIVVP